MTLDSFIAIAGLLIAAYQIMPRARQLELALRFRLVDRLVITASLLSIIYLQFYSFFVSVGWSFNLRLSRWYITPERASFVVILITAIFIGLRLRFTRLSPRYIYKFRRLCDELLWSKNFPELIAILERNINRLIKVAENRFLLSIIRRRLRRDYDRWPTITYIEKLEDLRDEPDFPHWRPEPVQKLHNTLTSMVGNLRDPVARLIPDYSNNSSIAQNLLHDLLTSKELVSAIVNTRPYFGLQFLQLNLHEIQDFLKFYFQAQFANTSSILYYEIRNSQQVGLNRSYVIPETNRLLHFLFSDAKVAERLEIYRSIGETIITELDRLARKAEEDQYNLVQDKEFDESGRWESPLYAGLLLFDIMVTSALHQGITWHMWLPYFTYFNEGFVRNYSPRDTIVNPEGRDRIRYGYLLYELFSILVGWIRAIEYIPRDQANIILKSTSVTYENDNIPKTSIIILGQCLRFLLTSEKVEQRLKAEILHMVYRLYFDLRGIDNHDYAQVLLLVLKPGAIYFKGDEGEYRIQLVRGFESFDKFPLRIHHLDHLEELEKGLFK